MACFENPFEEEARLAQIEAQIGRAFERCFNGVQNVIRIVRAMREFSHPDQERRTASNINQAINTALTAARNRYKPLAEVETDLSGLPAVWCELRISIRRSSTWE